MVMFSFSSCQVLLQVLSFFDGSFTRWTAIGFEGCLDIGELANVSFIA